MRKVVMGLDLSLTSTGVSIIVPGKSGPKVDGFTFGYALKKGTQKEQLERMLNIASNVLTQASRYNVTDFVIEQSTFGNRYRAMELTRLTVFMETQILMKFRYVPVMINPISVRKFLMNKGKASKQDVQKFLEAKGFFLKNNDEYDALAVAMVVYKYYVSPPVNDYEEKMFTKIKKFLLENNEAL